MQTCKFFAHALNANLKAVTVRLLYDPEPNVFVQSFYVPPPLWPGLDVTVRLIEHETESGMTLYLGGFCFPEGRDDYYSGIQLQRFSVKETTRNTGPMEADKASAASELAKLFSDYWTERRSINTARTSIEAHCLRDRVIMRVR
jgi:hypothetical protein